jgi:hypothetical protein
MLIQGVPTKDCLVNLISPRQLSAKSIRRHPTHLSFRAQRHNNVCHFRVDGRGVEKSRGCVFRYADSGSFYEGLSRKPDFQPPSSRPGPYHVTQPICHFERSATTMVCHFRADWRGVEQSRRYLLRDADSGSFHEGLSRKPDLQPPSSRPGPCDVTQPICHFERSAATMFPSSGRMGAESRNPRIFISRC